MNILVGHFLRLFPVCVHTMNYTFDIQDGGAGGGVVVKNVFKKPGATRNSPLSSQIKAKTWEIFRAYPAEKAICYLKLMKDEKSFCRRHYPVAYNLR